jgi:hypothetical protein
VNPHNWRHYAYTKSQDLPIDESKRRTVFGWAPGSDTGSTVYGHTENEQAGRDFAEAWAEAFGDADTEGIAEQIVGDADTEGIAEQIVGDAVTGDLSPEARQALVQELVGDDAAKQELAEAVLATADAD